jgi:hypothetical protein
MLVQQHADEVTNKRWIQSLKIGEFYPEVAIALRIYYGSGGVPADEAEQTRLMYGAHVDSD